MLSVPDTEAHKSAALPECLTTPLPVLPNLPFSGFQAWETKACRNHMQHLYSDLSRPSSFLRRLRHNL